MGPKRPTCRSSLASQRRSFTPSMSAHSNESRRLFAAIHIGRRRPLVEGVAAVDGHELVAQLVVGGVERHGQVHRQPFAGEAADARHDADGRDREVAIGLWVGGFDILYACQDLEFDRRAGLRSIPTRFGVGRADPLSRAMHVAHRGHDGAPSAAAHLPALYLARRGVRGPLLAYEQSLVSDDDLSQVKKAFDSQWLRRHRYSRRRRSPSTWVEPVVTVLNFVNCLTFVSL